MGVGCPPVSLALVRQAGVSKVHVTANQNLQRELAAREPAGLVDLQPDETTAPA